MTRDYPRTIDSGGGQRITMRARGRDGNVEWLEVESEIAPGSGPPLHVHDTQDESITVTEGVFGYVCDGSTPQIARAGEAVVFERGKVHRFWNAGTETLRCTGRVSPPLRFEYFMSALYASTAQHGGRRPGLFDAAFLTHHFGSENRMVGMPAPVRLILFPLLRQIGQLTGRYEKYRDMPQ